MKMTDETWNKKINKAKYLSEFDLNNKKFNKIVEKILNKIKNVQKKN